MAVNFPNNPTPNQSWTDPSNSTIYTFANGKWISTGTGINANIGPQGPQGEPGAPGTSNVSQVITHDTGLLNDLDSEDYTISLAQVAILVSVELSHECWVRLYRSSAQRALDTRTVPGGTFQDMIDLGDAKPYAEVVSTTPGQTIILNPPPTIRGDSGGIVYARIQNQSGSPTIINTSYTVLKLEN